MLIPTTSLVSQQFKIFPIREQVLENLAYGQVHYIDSFAHQLSTNSHYVLSLIRAFSITSENEKKRKKGTLVVARPRSKGLIQVSSIFARVEKGNWVVYLLGDVVWRRVDV
jgi:hypothetical protein